MSGVNVTEATLSDAVARRHRRDLFVPQCKDGPTTTGSGHRRIDALAITRSWSNFVIDGYEIKVSRSDYDRDEKWPSYLSMCHRFWFVTPHGLVQPEEIPDGVGLLWATKSGTRVLVKKRPRRREIDIPVNVLRYLINSRMRLMKSYYSAAENAEEDAPAMRAERREWLARKAEDRKLGCAVARGLREAVAHKITAVQLENKRLARENEKYGQLAEALQSHGISVAQFGAMAKLVDVVRQRPDDSLIRHAAELSKSIQRFVTACG